MLIISMTTYPERFDSAVKAINSILCQKVTEEYKFVLVLCKEETDKLPNGLSNKVEVLWCDKNLRGHNKLLPTLKKYPNDDILVTDDDIIRDDGWLQMFIDDHKKHPTDVLAGTFMYYFDYNCMIHKHRYNGGYINRIPNIIMHTSKFCSGLGGTLFPHDTFTDKRFFDEDLIRKLCFTCDESWQYCFCVMYNKVIRQTSKVIDDKGHYIEGTQKMDSALYKLNYNLNIINKPLLDYFPKFSKCIKERITYSIINNNSTINISNYLHIIWLGDKPFKNEFIESYKYLPSEFNLKLWNNKHINYSCKYYEIMMTKKKYAYASDYIRFKILYEYGGLYIDTDVEFIKKIDKSLFNTSFLATEKVVNRVASGLIMYFKYPKHPILKNIIDLYESYDCEEPLIDGDILATELKKYGNYNRRDKYQIVNDIIVYPSEVFCPINFKTNTMDKTTNTLSIHWYNQSWKL